MRWLALLALLLAAGCIETDTPLSPASTDAPPGEDGAASAEEGGDLQPSPAPGSDADASARAAPVSVTLTDKIDILASTGANGQELVGTGKNAVFAVPRDAASTANLTATWTASRPTSAEMVIAVVVDGRLVPLGQGTSPLVLAMDDAFDAAGEHVVAAYPATGAAVQQTVEVTLVLTYA